MREFGNYINRNSNNNYIVSISDYKHDNGNSNNHNNHRNTNNHNNHRDVNNNCIVTISDYEHDNGNSNNFDSSSRNYYYYGNIYHGDYYSPGKYDEDGNNNYPCHYDD